MNFQNRVKGAITQTLMKSLLEDAGYRVIPLGVEEVVREVRALSLPEYTNLGLPKILKSLPDFLITDESYSASWLVEVKYRKEWNERVKEELRKEIQLQVQQWQPLLLTVFLGTSVKPDSDKPANSIGVIKLISDRDQLFCSWTTATGFNGKKEDRLTPWPEITWGDFRRLQDEFQGLGSRWKESTLSKSLNLLRGLRGLDFFE